MTSTCFIVNPASRGGRNLKQLETLRRWVRQHLPSAQWILTDGPGHAIELAAEAAQGGVERCISVGGDGTLNEVVNGVCAVPIAARPKVGVIPTGTGGDFARLLREEHPEARHWDWLMRPNTRHVDLGLARFFFEQEGVKAQERYFINIAHAGISAKLTTFVNSSNKKWGSAEYLMAIPRVIFDYKSPHVHLEYKDFLSGKQTGKSQGSKISQKDMDLLILIVANGRYFGGGMCVAPEAKVDDGKFQWWVAPPLPTLALLGQLPNFYRKRRMSHPQVFYHEGQNLKLRVDQGLLPVELDGEVFHASSVEFELLPKALEILVP